MKYKSKTIDFLTTEMKISDLCVYNDYYYFETDAELEQAEFVSDEEFKQAVDAIVYAESLTSDEPEPTQLDRIEESVNKSQQDIIDEYTLELIEGGVI